MTNAVHDTHGTRSCRKLADEICQGHKSRIARIHMLDTKLQLIAKTSIPR